MVQVDLITGFLGAGKTTFLRRYAAYLTAQGHHVCILENDFGAVNVDAMLVQDLLGERCEIETISGGCDCDTHQRRMRTKLISMAMRGFDRVVVILTRDKSYVKKPMNPKPIDLWYKHYPALAEQLNAQDTFVLTGQDYARAKGDPGALLRPWYNKRVLDLSCVREHDDLLFSPALTEELVRGFGFLLPYYDYLEAVTRQEDA